MKKKSLLIGMAAMLFPMSMAAQYTIYPVPHTQTAGTGKVSFTKTVNVVYEDGIDTYTRNRVEQILTEHGLTARFPTDNTPIETESCIYLGIKGTNGIAGQKATALGLNTDVLDKANKFDRHILSLTDGGNGIAQLVVIGENTDATFYGLASLEQMLDQGTTDLPTVTINDYADLKERGIIEGFYGKPYDNEVRKDLMRYMMRFKMNTYVYGPKSDPYHSSTWAAPYPTTITETQNQQGFMTQAKMQDLTETAHATKVNVSWAIHPGNSLLNDGQVVSKIMSKFESMYNLGFRQFSVFVDDVDIPSDQSGMDLTCQRVTDIQRAIEAKWNTPGAAAADTVKALRLTPQIYCRGFVGSDTQFNNFFKALSKLPENVTVYYTGGGVWSVPNNDDLNTVQNQFGRNVIWWWNYPCNDNGTGPSEIYPLDMKSNFYDMPNVNSNSSLSTELTASNQGIICNPMEQGEASKTAVFSAGDYSWNNKGFDNNASWEAAIKSLFPGNEEATKAYRFLAPYLSKNDPDALNTTISTYKQNGNSEDLKTLLSQIEENCDVLSKLESSANANESLFYKDIKPWVVRLHDMATSIKDYLDTKDLGSDGEQAWPLYMKAMGEFNDTNESYFTHHLSGFGSTSISTEPRLTHASYRYLTPFVDYMKANATAKLFPAKSTSTAATSYTNVEGIKVTGSITASLIRFQANKKVTLSKGDYLGIELPNAIRIKYVTMADSLIDHEKLNVVVSTDGKNWTAINRTGNEWLVKPEAGSSDFAGYARYVAIVNDSEEPLSVATRYGFVSLYPAQKASVSAAAAPDGAEFWQNHTANLISDGNYNTYVCINRVQQAGDAYTVTLKDETPVEHVRIVMGTQNGDNINKGIVQISNNGTTWTSLRPTGASSNIYTMDLPQNFKVGTVDGADVYACDFSPSNVAGKVTPITAKYVRLYVSTPNSDKWLRLHEIEVNGKGLNEMATFQAGQYGITERNATDGLGSTSTAGFAPYSSSKDRVFTYHMINGILLNGITLYTDPATMEGVTYSITTDGETWTDIEPTTANNGLIRFTLEGANRAATALKINWDTKTIPAIYEVAENYDAANVEHPTVTRIESVTGSTQSATEQIALTTEGSHLVAKAQSGISSVEAYTLDGRTLFSQKTGGESQVAIPVVGSAHQSILVKVTTLGGKSQTFKVMK